MKKLIVGSLLASLLYGCTGGKDQTNIEIIQDLMDQEAVKAQEYDDFFADKISSRVPPENTVPIGFKPYLFAKDLEGAKRNVNPYAGSKDPEILAVGQKYYETNCMLCHGQKLNGDGTIAKAVNDKGEKLYPINIPLLNSDKIKGWTDGEIYHVISVGQGVMGAYASHIPAASRWQVVNYIRFLQNNPK